MRVMGERMIDVGDVELWTEPFGDPADPTVLLNAGGGAPGIIWSEAFCEGLAAGGRHVIRYDYRDTGLSSRVDFDANPYTVDDLVKDAIGVLNVYDVSAAHLVGWSMGGVVAQTTALKHPDRVGSIVSISSTPLRGVVFSGGDGRLSGVGEGFLRAGAAMAAVPTSEVDRRVDRFVDFMKSGGITEPFDEEEVRAFARRGFTRSTRPANATNHVLAQAAMPECRGELVRITARTLVIHGANDLVLGVEHGRATAEAIPGARLLIIDGMGHIPRPEPKEMLTAILEHTAGVGAGREAT